LRVAPGRDLRLGVSVAVGDGAIPGAATTVFSSRRGRDVPTLRSGVYLLGLDAAAAWSTPFTLPALDDPAWRSLPATVMVVEERPGR
jgi:hypothetical protein